jgi:hypothetical protein
MIRSLILSALAVAAPLAAHAQPISAEALDAMFDSEPVVEVNLRGSLLRLAAEAARADEPEAALMLDGLRGVTVRIYPTGPTRELAVSRLADVGRSFEADGWLTLVRVRSLPDDDGSEGDVWVYVRDEGEAFGGMAVMAVDEDEEQAVFVLIDGTIDPSQVGALSRRFADVDIDEDEDADVDVDRDDDDDQ